MTLSQDELAIARILINNIKSLQERKDRIQQPTTYIHSNIFVNDYITVGKVTKWLIDEGYIIPEFETKYGVYYTSCSLSKMKKL